MLSKDFSLKDLGSLHYFLGIEASTRVTYIFLKLDTSRKFYVEQTCLNHVLNQHRWSLL